MTHRATHGFWALFDQLPGAVQRLARKNHRLLDANPRHPSLHFKRVGGKSPPLWSVRVGREFRALALEKDGVAFWFWIGSHAEYDRILG